MMFLLLSYGTMVLLQSFCSTPAEAQTVTVTTTSCITQGSIIQGDQVTINCVTTDQSATITFTAPGSVNAGGCSGGVCNSLVTGYSIVQTDSTTTTLTISSADYNRDNGNWVCVYGASTSPTAAVSVLSQIRNDSTITDNANSDRCLMKCQFPVSGSDAFSNVQIGYTNTKLSRETINTSTVISTLTPAAADGCAGHEMNVYVDFDVSSAELCGKNTFFCRFNHACQGEKQTSNTVEITKTDYSLYMLIGWLLGIVAFVLICVFCGLFQTRFIRKRPVSEFGCFLKNWLLVGFMIGAVVLSLIIVIVVALVAICYATIRPPIGLGIGISLGMLCIVSWILLLVLFCVNKGKCCCKSDDLKCESGCCGNSKGDIVPSNEKADETNAGNKPTRPKEKSNQGKTTPKKSLTTKTKSEHIGSSPAKPRDSELQEDIKLTDHYRPLPRTPRETGHDADNDTPRNIIRNLPKAERKTLDKLDVVQENEDSVKKLKKKKKKKSKLVKVED